MSSPRLIWASSWDSVPARAFVKFFDGCYYAVRKSSERQKWEFLVPLILRLEDVRKEK